MAHIEGDIIIQPEDLTGRLHAHVWTTRDGRGAAVLHLPGDVRISAGYDLTPEQLADFLERLTTELRSQVAAYRAQQAEEGSDV